MNKAISKILTIVIPGVLGLVLGFFIGRGLPGPDTGVSASAYRITQPEESEDVEIRDGVIRKLLPIEGVVGQGTYTAENTYTTSVTGPQVLYLSVDDNTTLTLSTPTYDQMLFIRCEQDQSTDSLFIPALTTYDTVVGDRSLLVFYDKANTAWREILLN